MEKKQQMNKHHTWSIRAQKRKTEPTAKTVHRVHKQNDNAKWKKESHEEVKKQDLYTKTYKWSEQQKSKMHQEWLKMNANAKQKRWIS